MKCESVAGWVKEESAVRGGGPGGGLGAMFVRLGDELLGMLGNWACGLETDV